MAKQKIDKFNRMMYALTLIALGFAMIPISLDTLHLAGVTFYCWTLIFLGVVSTLSAFLFIIFGIIRVNFIKSFFHPFKFSQA